MAAELVKRMEGFWQARNPRERRVLSLGSLVLLLAVGYGLIYAPIEASRAKLADRLQRLRAEHRQLLLQVEELRREQAVPARTPQGTADLPRLAAAVARSLGLADGEFQASRIDGGMVQFSGSARPVRTWLEWVAELQRQGVRVKAAQLKMTGTGDEAQFVATLMAATEP